MQKPDFEGREQDSCATDVKADLKSAILAKFRVIPHYRGEPAAPKYQFNRCKPFRAIPFAPGNPRIHPFSRTESGR